MITPKKTVHKLTLRDRIFGNALELPEGVEPENDSQRDLAGDAFFGLYTNPAMTDDPQPERAVNRALMDYARTLDAWQDARTFCDRNAVTALTTSQILWEKLRSDEAIQDALKQQEIADQAQRDADAMQAAADALQDIDQEQAAAMQERADEANQKADELTGQLQQRAQDLVDNRLNKSIIANAVKAGKDAGREVALSMAGWGMDAGQISKVGNGNVREFMKRTQGRKLSEIARLAGRFRGIGFDARHQRVVEGIMPDDIMATQDPLIMFPDELAKISPHAPEALRKLALAEFARGGLPGWELKGDAMESGPFVGAVDVSGSMGGMREIYGKAVTLGIAQIAKSETRHYELFSFSSSEKTINVNSQDDWSAHMDWAENTIRGGTNFDIALKKAMGLLDKIADGKQAGAADVVFVSDGEARVSASVRDAWIAYKERTGSRLFYVSVGHRGYRDIEDLADRVFSIAELEAESADNLTRQLATSIA